MKGGLQFSDKNRLYRIGDIQLSDKTAILQLAINPQIGDVVVDDIKMTFKI